MVLGTGSGRWRKNTIKSADIGVEHQFETLLEWTRRWCVAGSVMSKFPVLT